MLLILFIKTTTSGDIMRSKYPVTLTLSEETKKEFRKVKGNLIAENGNSFTDDQTVYELIQRYNQNRK